MLLSILALIQLLSRILFKIRRNPLKERIKKFIIAAVLLGTGYILASYHIIIYGTSFKLLEKSFITFEYTFLLLDNNRPENLLKIDMLREAGIGDILVKLGRLSETKRWELENKYSYESEYE